MTRGELTKLYNTVEELLGLKRRTIKHYKDLDWVTICNDIIRLNDSLRKYDSRRIVKDYVYSIDVATDCKNAIWNAFVEKYMSHIFMTVIPIRDVKSSQVNKFDMPY